MVEALEVQTVVEELEWKVAAAAAAAVEALQAKSDLRPSQSHFVIPARRIEQALVPAEVLEQQPGLVGEQTYVVPEGREVRVKL